ncbi:uncharacterized protein LOC135829758 [Sycon ciliatum]|uniref:uncharacterized protein LOC135829758 n=1 Tax=Sycon ciliatum TaxID=27933 RepID=UPI0020A9E01E|eukprot:scpid64083/ scgid30428/ Putative protein PHLOEM PROTEIN 2-LIKE A3
MSHSCELTLVSGEENEPDPHPSEKPDRVVILMGRTGNGKSTLANVIAGRPRGDLFPESARVLSETVGTPSKRVAVRYGTSPRKRYVLKIVDTIGFGDTGKSAADVLKQLGDLASDCRSGIHQLLFVTRGRFTKEEEDVFDLVRTVIFESSIIHHICVVRTGCDDFEDEEQNEAMRRELRTALPLLKSVKIIPVNNTKVTRRNERGALEERAISRQRLLTHLITQCSSAYVPSRDVIRGVQGRIEGHVREQNRHERELQETKTKLLEFKSQVQRQKNQQDIDKRNMDAAIARMRSQEQSAIAEAQRSTRQLESAQRDLERSQADLRSKAESMTRDARVRDRLQQRVRNLEQELEKKKARLARSESERSFMQLSVQVTKLLINSAILRIELEASCA